jgi:dehydration protein DpgD
LNYQHLAVKKGSIYTVTFNRPERMNALAYRTFDEIAQVCEDFNQDSEGRVMIVTGAGDRAFSSGVDLKERTEGIIREGKGFEYASFRDWTRYGFLPAEKPVIAAINGYCLAGGLEMSLTCDIRIAADHATFGLPEPRVGIVPGQALAYLARLVPMGEAMYLMLTGERITSQDAYRIGLIHQVVPPAELMSTAQSIAQSILECAPLSLQAIKKAVRQTTFVPPELASRLLSNILQPIGESEDAKEGPRAFVEKRKPIWKGH